MKFAKYVIFGLLLVLVAGGSYIAGAVGAAKGGMTSADTLNWQKFGDSPLKVAKLWGDRDTGAYGMLFKLPPGFKAGVHAHTADYNGISLAGTWVHTMDGETKELPPGSYVMQPGGAFHDDSCKGPEECILLIQQDAKGDFIPEKK
jgi:quercetin dioxygenase-like cupin family protein